MSKPIPGFWPEQSLCQEAYKDETGEWKIIGTVLIMLGFQSLWTVLLGTGMTNRLLVKGQTLGKDKVVTQRAKLKDSFRIS